jgi:hypothetical protein
MPAMSGKSYKSATPKGYGKKKVTKKKPVNKKKKAGAKKVMKKTMAKNTRMIKYGVSRK